jgi:hypothetical protein
MELGHADEAEPMAEVRIPRAEPDRVFERPDGFLGSAQLQLRHAQLGIARREI